MDSTYLHVGCEPQLFIDSWLIECTQGATRRWHKPVRSTAAPLITADKPWEKALYFTYSNYAVLRDPADGLIKCWYEDLGPLDGKGHPWRTRLLYAESEDGRLFHKPELDVCQMDGRRTNVVMGYVGAEAPTRANPWAGVGVHSNGIAIDPLPPTPDERFRTIFSRSTYEEGVGLRHRIQCAHSPDGVHWVPYGSAPRLGSSGSHLSDVSCLHYDVDARQFVQNTRHGLMYTVAHLPGTPSVAGWFGPYYPHRPDLMNKRRVYQTRSHDFLHWTDPLPVSVPDDELDNLDEAHYGMQQFRVGRMHFGTLGVLRFVDNEMEVRLLHSRDGLHFRPADRGNAFLSPRGPGHWDAHMVSVTSPPVEMGDEWWFYHGGTNVHHDWWIGPPEGIDEPEARDPQAHVHFGLGLATMRKEGIASLDAARQRTGYVVTRPLQSSGKRLVVNAACRPGGWLRAAVLDLRNQPFEGRSLDDSDVFTGDSTSHTLTWAGEEELPGTGTWRKLHIELRDAALFSVRLADAS